MTEAEVTGYSAAYTSGNDSDGAVCWTITNTHEPETTELTITKVWKDNNNKEGYRPKQVKVQLFHNGKIYGDAVTLSKANSREDTVTVPVYDNGSAIRWTIAESNIPKYYRASYDQKTLTVTNTLQSKDIPKTGDDSNLMTWMSLMLISCAGLLVVLSSQRKKRNA